MKRKTWQNRLAGFRREFTVKRALLVLILTFNTRTFEYFPGGRVLEELWFVLCFVSVAFLLPVFKIQAGWRFSKLELYLFVTMIALVVIPATSAARVFDQPFFYGVLAKRSMILLGTWILLLNAWRRNWFSDKDLERSLLFLVWGTALLYGFMRVFLNPANYPDAPIGFILGFGQEETFSVPGYLLPFGTLYYILRGLRSGSLVSYALGLLIFAINTGSSWRALSLSFAGTIVIFLFLWKPLGSAVLLLTRILVVALLVIGVVRLAKPVVVQTAITHLTDALDVAAGKGPGQDPSANARIEEAATALPYVKANPVLGAGLLSVQWHGGALGVLGVYFSDVDIGILGVLFSYGLVGLMLGLYQYKFALQAALRSRSNFPSSFLDGTLGYVVFSVLFSLPTGLFVAYIETTSLFVLIAFELSRQDARVEELPATRESLEPAVSVL